jgi:hypothetical protein
MPVGWSSKRKAVRPFMPENADFGFDSLPIGRDPTPARARRWLALVALSPVAVWLLVLLPGLAEWARARPGLALIVAGAAGALPAVAVASRTRFVATVRRRILHARPTERCRVCGYSSTGLETTRVESGTLPFDQARCPECGRANPR